MADTITFGETAGDGIFARAIWAALCEDRSVFAALGVIAGASDNSRKALTIECKINGIEISLKGYLERLKEDLDRRIRNQAREQLKDYLHERGAGDRIDTMNRVLDKFEKELVAEFFPNDPDFNPNER